MRGVAIAAVAVGLGFGVGWSLRDRQPPPPAAIAPAPADDGARVERRGGLTFARPLLECDLGGAPARLAGLRDTLDALVLDAGRHRRAANVSVYVRDLQTTEEVAVGEGLKFSPASLLKLPVVLTVLKVAEEDRGLLDRAIPFEAHSDDFTQQVAVDDPLVPGRAYTVRELMERTLIRSDNDAVYLLHDLLKEGQLERTYTELGLHAPPQEAAENFYTVREYAAFFRVLYNAAYISPDRSEWAMDVLTRVDFRDGLVAGVPEGVAVAHKFGERYVEGAPPGAHQQLHDCGIVYAPGHPYLLCVMTRGAELAQLAGVLRDVSAAVYADFARRAPF